MKKNEKNLIYWGILVALGVFLLLGHGIALQIISKVIGVGLILAAVSGIYTWWKTKSKKLEAIARLVGSLAILGLGLWVILSTGDFIRFMGVSLGFVIILTAALTLYRGIKAEKHTPTIILAIAGIALGLIIACTDPTKTWLVSFEGIGLIYASVTGYLGEKKHSKEASK